MEERIKPKRHLADSMGRVIAWIVGIAVLVFIIVLLKSLVAQVLG